jgi:hypothetical protein
LRTAEAGANAAIVVSASAFAGSSPDAPAGRLGATSGAATASRLARGGIRQRGTAACGAGAQPVLERQRAGSPQ